MPNDEHVALLRQGAAAWNAWRVERDELPELSRSGLRGLDLSGFDLSGADLRDADLRGADLRQSGTCPELVWTGRTFSKQRSMTPTSPGPCCIEPNSSIVRSWSSAGIGSRRSATTGLPVAQLRHRLSPARLLSKSPPLACRQDRNIGRACSVRLLSVPSAPGARKP
jgi:hypothetical protein